MRIVILIGMLLISTLNSFAQSKRTNQWYFYQNAGLDFNQGNPTYTTDGKMDAIREPQYQILGLEGCASVADSNGNLLFYFDGITVWNKNHQIMDNGMNLAGHWSSSQGAIIIPKPKSEHEYFLFTLDERSALHPAGLPGIPGLHFSTVDMSENNGLGRVFSKNVLLPGAFGPTEKMTAVQTMDGSTYWLITQRAGSNEFYALEINELGIRSFIKSNAGTPCFRSIGMMAFSSSGTQMVQLTGQGELIELYYFDQNTGVFTLGFSVYHEDFKDSYGFAFSPNERFLYMSGGYVTSNTSSPQVFQLDLEAGSPSDIENSLVSLYNFGDTTQVIACGSAQLGPDGKVYIATMNENSLAVVNKPNLKAPNCEFKPYGQSLGIRTASLALPNFVDNWFIDCHETFKPNFGNDTTLCFGDSIILRSNTPVTKVIWQDGSMDKNYTINRPGTYIATTWQFECKSVDTIKIDSFLKIQNDLGNDTTLCPGESIVLSAKEANASYSWQDGTIAPEYLASRPGTYFLTTTVELCSQTDTFKLKYFEPPIFDLGSDTTIYSTDDLQLDASSSDPEATYFWNDGYNSPIRVINTPDLYIVEVLSNGCTFSDSIRVGVADLIIPNIITPNSDGINESFIIRGSGYEQWNLQIFDRFGRPVYKSDNYPNDWQATGLEAGTYYYALIDRKTEKIFKGWVLVIR